jgi:hypothetical protein
LEKSGVPLEHVYFSVLGFFARGALDISLAVIPAAELKTTIENNPTLHSFDS